MATSGEVWTNSYDGKRIYWKWWRTSVDIGANRTTIHWELRLHRDSGSNYVYASPFRVTIDNLYAFDSGTRLKCYNEQFIGSGDWTFDHDRIGNKSFSVKVEAGIYVKQFNVSGSGSFTLDSIPRYLDSCNIYSNGRELNSISVKWSCNPARDWTQYRLNDGNWIDAGDSVAGDNKSGFFEIRGLNPNAQYKVQVRLRRTDSGLWSETNSIWITTKPYATVTSPNTNFSINNEQSLTIKINKPCKNDVTYFLQCPQGTERYRSGRIQDTSYTFSSEQIKELLKFAPNNNSISLEIGVITWGDSVYYSTSRGVLNVVNSNPSFSNFTYEDTDSTCITLTGGNKKIIKGYSNVKIIISTANKAVAKNYATMKKYLIVIGGQQQEVAYSSNSSVSKIISNVDNNIFNVYAIDSRGNSKIKTISPDAFLNYYNIATKNASIARTDGVGSEVTLSFDGSFWNNSFGAINNSIIDCHYEYKKTTSNSWINGEKLNPDISGDNFSFSGTIKGDLGANGFSVTSGFNVRIIVKDRLSTHIYNLILGSGTPAIAIHKNGIAINGMFDTSKEKGLQVFGSLYVNGKKIY